MNKSRYVEAMSCQRKLWLHYHHPELAAAPSLADQRTMDEGTRVGVVARQLFYPDGVLIAESGSAGLAATQQALRQSPSAIFEATFQHHGVLVMCDLLINNGDGTWDILEVKASTRQKPEHVHDLAIQAYVVAGSGIQLRRTRLLLMDNSKPASQDQRQLFQDRDITDAVSQASLEIESAVDTMHAVVRSQTEPTQAIGAHCLKPQTCPFKAHCWQGVPEPSVFSIPRLKGTEKSVLAEQGILHLADLPDDYPLGYNQRKAVGILLNEREEIDWQAIQRKLESLQYPLYFFDFETDAAAIPQHSGLKPYEAVPFQYSCHILHEDGNLEHTEYLHCDTDDPRGPLLESMLTHIGATGSVVVYNAAFERSVLRKLAEFAPTHRPEIESLIERLWDQLDIFKHDYRSYRFGGSNSIKKVLPVVAPHLSYGALNVQRGDQAQAVWNRMILLAEDNPSQQVQKELLIADLLAYCELDTLAMVEIHRHLETFGADEAEPKQEDECQLVPA